MTKLETMEGVMSRNLTAPSLYVKREGEQTTKLELRLTRVPNKVVVRFTGGCGNMDRSDAQNLVATFCEAFDGFQGAILFGGTRMVKPDKATDVYPTITEIPPAIRDANPGVVILGIVPKTREVQITESGILICPENSEGYITVIHPNQDECLLVQKNVDDYVPWEAEMEECLRITESLREFAGFTSLLVSYNGGAVTEKEILETARRGWPVLLIAGSGRKTDEYANKADFLQQYPNVFVVPSDPVQIQSFLIRGGLVAKAPKLSLVSGRIA